MKNVGKILVALLALAIMLSFSSVIAFADETEEDSVTTTEAAKDETEKETEAETKAESKPADDGHDHDKETTATDKKEETKKDNFVLYTGLITLGIVVIILICVLVWILKDKERALKTWRSFKSEFKKIVWAEKHDTMKKTILVIVALVVFGVVIGLLDYLFSAAVVGLGKLI